MYTAIKNKNVKAVSKLLELGVDPNEKCGPWNSDIPIVLAGRYDSGREIVDILKEHGLNTLNKVFPKTWDTDELTPLNHTDHFKLENKKITKLEDSDTVKYMKELGAKKYNELTKTENKHEKQPGSFGFMQRKERVNGGREMSM